MGNLRRHYFFGIPPGAWHFMGCSLKHATLCYVTTHYISDVAFAGKITSWTGKVWGKPAKADWPGSILALIIMASAGTATPEDSLLRQRIGTGGSTRKEQPESEVQSDTPKKATAGTSPQQQTGKSAYGRTPDGTSESYPVHVNSRLSRLISLHLRASPVFKIPHTHDVLTGLFDPRLPKSSLDLVTLATLGSQVLLWLYLPNEVSKWLFMVLFAFWRLAYK